DQNTFEAELLRELIVCHLNAETRPRYLAVADELRHHAVDLIHRDGEADPGVGPGRAEDRRVDTDQPAGAVQQRTARVARVDGRVRLDHVLHGPPRDRFDLPPQRADDAGRQTPVQAEGVADGEDLLSHLQVVRGAHQDGPQAVPGHVDLQDSQVLVWE